MHVPQLRRPPHPSPTIPQLRPSAAQVVGVHTHVPATQDCDAVQHKVPAPHGTTSPTQALQPVPWALHMRVPVWQLLTPGVPAVPS